jgi:O-6-methylguanine DNA methyltransferase
MTDPLTTVALPTALGTFQAVLSREGVRELRFPNQVRPAAPADDPRAGEVAGQLDDYLAGRRRGFTVPLDLRGTPFQLQVWAALREIPFGEVRSYAEVASAIGRPVAVRAVGAANGANPVPIVVPCHRVIGTDGRLVGFGPGIEWKVRLLAIEDPDRWGVMGQPDR